MQPLVRAAVLPALSRQAEARPPTPKRLCTRSKRIERGSVIGFASSSRTTLHTSVSVPCHPYAPASPPSFGITWRRTTGSLFRYSSVHVRRQRSLSKMITPTPRRILSFNFLCGYFSVSFLLFCCLGLASDWLLLRPKTVTDERLK